MGSNTSDAELYRGGGVVQMDNSTEEYRLPRTDNPALVNRIYTILSEISRRVQFSLQNNCIVYCARDKAMETQYGGLGQWDCMIMVT